MSVNDGFFSQVYEVIAAIPEGFVMSYGQIAAALGNPRASRAVGWAVRAAPERLACHRVVHSDGGLCEEAFGGLQRVYLAQEGVAFTPSGKVDMGRCRWLKP